MRPNYLKRLLLCLGALMLFLAIISELAGNSTTYRYSDYTSYGSAYKSSSSNYTSTPKHALTKAQADARRGSGYKGTRPNSEAENMELAAAQVKCDVCGMHTTNGLNSACNSCRAKGYR